MVTGHKQSTNKNVISSINPCGILKFKILLLYNSYTAFLGLITSQFVCYYHQHMRLGVYIVIAQFANS